MKLALACVFGLSAVASAQCASASCFGPAGTDPLVISGAWSIASGANLDFGPRHVILAPGAVLSLGGPASIQAARVTAQAGSSIDGTAVVQSDLSITTTPAGPHDGSATLSGTVNLNGWPSGNLAYQSAGSFTLNGGGAATLQSLEATAGIPGNAGSVTITAPAITVGTIVADLNEYYNIGAAITLTSTGPVAVGSIHAVTSTYSVGSTVSISGSSYTQTGNIVAAPVQGAGFSGGCSVTINATGTVLIQGHITTGDGTCEFGGGISITAGGALSWPGALALASGGTGGYISLHSLGSDVLVNGSLIARTEWDLDNGGGSVHVHAAGQLDFTGTLDVGTAQTYSTNNYGTSSWANLTAGRTLRVHSGSVVQARDLAGGCTSAGGSILLDGCRVVIEPGASVIACGNHPMFYVQVHVVTRELIRVDGAILAGAALGQVVADSRLPWQAALAGAGTMMPPPVVTVNPTLSPCAAESTTVTATSPVTAGQSITLSVATLPLRSLVVLADLSIAHLQLGLLGWTQVNVFTAYRIADDVGVLGPPIPAASDGGGQWSWSLVTPVTPLLSNADVHFDVYVIDPASLNGVFQQSPAIIHFN